jgi:hypothetical protein
MAEEITFLEGYLAEQEEQRKILEDSFLTGYRREQGVAVTCPTWPATTKVAAESRANYQTLKDNLPTYGLTALMAVNTWESSCYGEVRPGYVWLFPGSYAVSPPAYKGTVRINCAPHPPLGRTGTGPLHAQLCAALGRPTTDFVGFAIADYPYSTPGAVHYNSCTCNSHWFDSCTLSTNCDGHNWQALVDSTLAAWL